MNELTSEQPAYCPYDDYPCPNQGCCFQIKEGDLDEGFIGICPRYRGD